MSSFLNGDRKQKLVFGYATQSCHNQVPTDIALQVLQFYDNTVYWILKGDELSRFYQCKNRSYLAGPKFTLYDVEFENTLCPNGWYQEDDGYTTYFLELKNLPPHVDRITIEYLLYCEQLDYAYKRSICYHRSHKNAHGWGGCVVRFDRFAPNNQRYLSLEFGCSIDVVHVEYCADGRHFNLGQKVFDLATRRYGLVERLNVNYGDNSVGVRYMGDDLHSMQWLNATDVVPAKMAATRLEETNNGFGRKYSNIISVIPEITEARFEWNIEGKLLRRFQNAEIDELFYSENFGNNCWFLMCKPFGSKTNQSENHCMVALRLWRIPIKLSSSEIFIHYNFETRLKTKSGQQKCRALAVNMEQFGMNGDWKHLRQELFESSTLKELSSLTIAVHLTVPKTSKLDEVDLWLE